MGIIASKYAAEASLVSSGYSESELALARKVSEIELAAGPEAQIQTIVDKYQGTVKQVRISITYVRRENGK